MSFQRQQQGQASRGNPAFRGNIFATSAQAYLGTERMTVEGTLNKTLLLIGICIVTAFVEVALFMSNPAVGMTMGGLSCLAGFGVAMATIFKPNWSPVTAPLYGILEGFVLGFISLIFEKQYPGVVMPAVGLTLFSALAMLILYRSQVIRVTPTFVKIVLFGTIAAVLTYGIAIVAAMFGAQLSFLTHPTIFGIGFSLFVIVIGCMNLILDFDFVAKGASYGSPQYLEWYGAFSILITLVWLYMEFLRLLAKLRN